MKESGEDWNWKKAKKKQESVNERTIICRLFLIISFGRGLRSCNKWASPFAVMWSADDYIRNSLAYFYVLSTYL